ncbi:MAG: hypothetical protein ABEK17_02270 [Candidatus Aenigmatarchaeota archaeon]
MSLTLYEKLQELDEREESLKDFVKIEKTVKSDNGEGVFWFENVDLQDFPDEEIPWLNEVKNNIHKSTKMLLKGYENNEVFDDAIN